MDQGEYFRKWSDWKCQAVELKMPDSIWRWGKLGACASVVKQTLHSICFFFEGGASQASIYRLVMHNRILKSHCIAWESASAMVPRNIHNTEFACDVHIIRESTLYLRSGNHFNIVLHMHSAHSRICTRGRAFHCSPSGHDCKHGAIDWCIAQQFPNFEISCIVYVPTTYYRFALGVYTWWGAQTHSGMSGRPGVQRSGDRPICRLVPGRGLLAKLQLQNSHWFAQMK